MTSTIKYIHINQEPQYIPKKVERFIMKNPMLKNPLNLFIKCQTIKCHKEFTNYIISLTKNKNYGIIMEKGSLKEKNALKQKIRKSKEYNASVKCLIDKCFDEYISDMKKKDKNIPKMKVYYKELISVYNEIIKELDNVKVDDKLIRALNKHKSDKLNKMSKKDIQSMYKKFIKTYKILIKETRKICNMYTIIETKVPLFDRLLKEDNKEEYIFQRTFDMY